MFIHSTTTAQTKGKDFSSRISFFYGNNWKDFRFNWGVALGFADLEPADIEGVCREGDAVNQGGDPGLALATLAAVRPVCDEDEDCDGRVCDLDLGRCVPTIVDVPTGGVATKIARMPTKLLVNTEVVGETLVFSDLRGSFGSGALAGEEVSKTSITLREPATATLDSDGAFSIPAGAANFTLFANIALIGDGTFNASNHTPIRGVYDEATGVFTVAGTIRDALGVFEGRFDFTMAFVNRPPHADAGADRVVECSGVQTELVGAWSDPDGEADVRRVSWRVGDAIVNTSPALFTLPLGTHAATMTVVDQRGSFDTDEISFSVVDTTPPTITDFAFDGPVCLSPPNHKYVVLRVGEDFTALVEDACDPNARLVITSAVSSQPENSIGDGDTEDDVVVFPDRVCLRGERQGGEADRIYTVHTHAVDAAGNSSDPTVQIRVAHDQSDRDCPHLDASLFADEGDPLCEPIEPTAEAASARRGAGCSSVSSSVFGGLALLLFLRRRRARD